MTEPGLQPRLQTDHGEQTHGVIKLDHQIDVARFRRLPASDGPKKEQ